MCPRPRRLYVCPADMRGEWTFAPILSRQRRENDFADSRRNQYWNHNLELSEVVKLYLRIRKMITFWSFSFFVHVRIQNVELSEVVKLY